MTKLLLLAMAVGHPEVDNCAHSLVAHGYEPAAARYSRAYTDCMTFPWLPPEEELSDRLERCAPLRAAAMARARSALLRDPDFRLRSAAASLAAEAPFRWIDHIAANFPGCETALFIAGDGRELPNVSR